MSQTKCCCSHKSQNIWPLPNFWLATLLVQSACCAFVQSSKVRHNMHTVTGFQIQNVDCYQTHRAKGYVGLARRLDDVRSCDLTRMPFGTQKCHMPCPGQCVLSKWSSWQPCVGDDGLPVGRNGTCHGSRRKRTRQILREPDESG